jgi:hypothetical protein
LYKDYVRSTQKILLTGENPTELKGKPLENVAKYFLANGGIVNSINSISAPGKWQIDGQGVINRTALIRCFGDHTCKDIGVQLFMEAKNHSEPVTNEEFSVHYRRMEEHCCNLGVFFSSAGYKIGSGKGIAESIHHNFLRLKFHLLLTCLSLQKALGKDAPLSILQETWCYAANDAYQHDKTVQENYTEKFCLEFCKAEFKRLFS